MKLVLEILHNNGLLLKQTKCSFGKQEVGYLGHVISHKGVHVDQTKIEAITTWPQSSTVRAVRGFLGLSGYYRKFIQNYGVIAAPLTLLLKKTGFFLV